MIQPCGHTICEDCTGKLESCCVCGKTIKKENLNLNYSLHEILSRGSKTIDKLFKICFIGSSGVGKTSLIRMLAGKPFIFDIPTTIGYDFVFYDRKVGRYNLRLQMWDSAGEIPILIDYNIRIIFYIQIQIKLK